MGKTVTTYLIDGDPKGTQYSFISNKICQMFVVPRSNLSYLSEQEKLQKPAFYILIGEDEAISHRLISEKRRTLRNALRIMIARRRFGKRRLSSFPKMQT